MLEAARKKAEQQSQQDKRKRQQSWIPAITAEIDTEEAKAGLRTAATPLENIPPVRKN